MTSSRIYFVCLGNICRSPMAEGLMRQKLKEHNLNWEVVSRGVDDYHEGESPDPRAQAIMKEKGHDISDIRSQQFHVDDFKKAHKVIAMDTSNYHELFNLAPSDKERDKLELMLEYLYPGKRQSVPDPYWDDDGFELVYKMLDKSLDAFIAHERQNTKS